MIVKIRSTVIVMTFAACTVPVFGSEEIPSDEVAKAVQRQDTPSQDLFSGLPDTKKSAEEYASLRPRRRFRLPLHRLRLWSYNNKRTKPANHSDDHDSVE